MGPISSCDQPSAPRILLRQRSKHQSCGCLPVSAGDKAQDLAFLRRAVDASMGEEAKISHPNGPRYPDPQAAFAFVVEVPASLKIDQAARDLSFALLNDPSCFALLARQGAKIQSVEPDPRANRLRSRRV